MADLEGAVELVARAVQTRMAGTARDAARNNLGVKLTNEMIRDAAEHATVSGLPVLALSTILDALASITRERDAIKAEADETNGLLEEMRRQLTIAQDERDAMREGLKPFSDIGDLLNSETSGFEDGDKLAVCIASAGGEEISPNVEMARLSFGSFVRAAALVNGEGG